MVLIVFEGLISIYYINNMSELFDGMYEDNLLPLNEFRNIESEINNLRLNTYRYLSTTDPEKMDRVKEMILRGHQSIEKKIETGEKELKSIQALFNQNTKITQEIILLHYNFNTREAYQLMISRSQEVYDQLLAQVLRLTEEKKQTAANNLKAGHTIKTTILFVMGSVIFFSILLTVVIGTVFSNNLTNPIYKISSSLHLLGKGDLSTRLDPEILNRADEFGSIAQDYETTKTQLATLITNLQGINKEFQHAKEAAEAANAAKSEFLANMSHEIRTPMNAILGFAEIMKSKVKEPSLSHYLESIHSSGKSLLSLINDILDLSKVEAGKLKLEYTATSPQALFREMETIFGQIIKDKGLELIIDISPDLPQVLLLDEIRLRQILINLIGNAVKFTDSGYVKLSADCHYPDSTYQSALDFIFSVEDTGKGIPGDQKQSIFETFTQVKGQKSSEFGGTGLGLAITKRLIEMLNGEINVDSTIDKGSTFQILLKEVEVASLRALESNQQKHIDFQSVRFQNSTVLVADDIDFNRDLIKGFLEDYELTITEAENGKEAIEMARIHRPQLILLDIKMPEMDGFEAAAILKKEEGLNTIPIIAVTASAMKENEPMINSLYDLCLKKPISKTDLISGMIEFLPHTIIKAENPDILGTAPTDSSLDLSSEISSKLPDLLEILKTKQKESIELSKRNVIHEIENFAEEIQKLGTNYHYRPLIHWGEKLYSATSEFDIEKIRQCLSNLQTIVLNIEKQIDQSIQR